ncbi:unnamed protein product [Lymnaea stagnalis]|uniref:Ectonucleotide pyrophosphatase/phosphodiesterase family member 5 n=1 Tax=Lymnaea stagnalis TaxID=6523 RepID=A0AAV2HW47_LYMST
MQLYLKSTILLSMFYCASGRDTKVILVSMDGFRNDYLGKTKTPYLDNLISSGVTMKYMNNSFVTNTFPCHYTMATGLYPETHGIVGNGMYDPEFASYFTMSTTEPRWWEGGEPIWITAIKHGLKAGVCSWPGSDVSIYGQQANKWISYSQPMPPRGRVDKVMAWMSEDNFDLGVLHFDEPDLAGHHFGPEDPKLIQVIEEMDSIIGYLIHKIESAGLMDKVNLIVTSDHGMTSIDLENKLVDLSLYVNRSLLEAVVDQESTFNLLPHKGREDDVVAALSKVEHIHVMLRRDIPERFHLKHNRRALSVFAYADEGWTMTMNTTQTAELANTGFKGNHGYDNELISMKPIFIASGPAFKVNVTVDPIQSVDIYPLICHLLHIESEPNNGSLERVNSMLKNHSRDGFTPLVTLTPIFIILLLSHLIW